MNFDELKSQWGQEDIPEESIPALKLALKHSNNAIDKVRSNMKKDFWGFIALEIIGLALLLIVPCYIYIHHILSFILWSFFLLFSIITGYFLFKFYRFYKKSYKLSYSMKDNLWWFYYELRSFIDFYYTFNFVSLMMGISCGLSLGYIGGNLKLVKGEDNLVSTSMEKIENIESLFLVIMVFVVISGMIGLHYLINHMYGKHLKQLKNTLDLLRDNNDL